MRVYDCDDDIQFAVVSSRVDDEGLMGADLLQTFAPDLLADARNRGFRPA